MILSVYQLIRTVLVNIEPGTFCIHSKKSIDIKINKAYFAFIGLSQCVMVDRTQLQVSL